MLIVNNYVIHQKQNPESPQKNRRKDITHAPVVPKALS